MEDMISFESTRTVAREEFARWLAKRPPDDVYRYELLNGRIIMNPPAGGTHGSVAVRIARLLMNFVEEGRLGHVFDSSTGYDLASGDTVSPDASFVAKSRLASPPEEFLTIAPDLAVEILSPSTASRDRGEKKAIYERNGVPEYWLIDHRAREVTIFLLTDGRYDRGRVFGVGQRFASTVLAGLEVEVAGLFPE
jgi:Uma2 family endonuclease